MLAIAVVGTVAVAALALIGVIVGVDSEPHPNLILQPPLSSLNARTRRRLAPASRRVDLAAPSFSSASLRIVNPLFPVSELRSAILVGRLEGVPWRAETTLLPRTEVVLWNGTRVRTLLSQFVAYLDGRLFEVAVDRYAQADDGSVWYLGEDAYTYEHGRLSDRQGTWLAGKDGPPAMIMPAHPRVGDVYRTENIPGVVFEQVTVEKTGRTQRGPTGLVHGVLVGRELHMDEVRLERKEFAPGYGEFFSGGGRTYEATALVVQAHSLPAPVPAPLKAIFRSAIALAGATGATSRRAASSALAQIGHARTRLLGLTLPERLSAELAGAIATLERTIATGDKRSQRLAALDVANASLDLQLQHRAPAEIDADRLALWSLRAVVDARAGDRAFVRGDVATLTWIRDRIAFPRAAAARIDDVLRRVRTAASTGTLRTVVLAAVRMRVVLSRLGTQ